MNYSVSNNSVVTVGTGSTAVLSFNGTARYRLFVNDGDEAMYLSLGGTAALNSGIRLNANGGSYEMNRGDGNLFQGAVTAICTSGGKKLLVTEGI